jgi:hypothetical protein
MSAEVIHFPTAERAAPRERTRAMALTRPEEEAHSGPSEWEQLRARVAAARPDLTESAAYTCAHDIEEGRLTFEQVAAGDPVNDWLPTLIKAHDLWKEAEASYREAVEVVARHCGRSPKAIVHVLQHTRKGHRIGPGGDILTATEVAAKFKAMSPEERADFSREFLRIVGEPKPA